MNDESLFCVLNFLYFFQLPVPFFHQTNTIKSREKLKVKLELPVLFFFFFLFFNQPNSLKSREKRLKGNSELLQEVFLFQKDGLNYYLVEANLKILRFDRQFNNRGVDLGSLNPSIFLLF